MLGLEEGWRSQAGLQGPHPPPASPGAPVGRAPTAAQADCLGLTGPGSACATRWRTSLQPGTRPSCGHLQEEGRTP